MPWCNNQINSWSVKKFYLDTCLGISTCRGNDLTIGFHGWDQRNKGITDMAIAEEVPWAMLEQKFYWGVLREERSKEIG